MLSRSTVGLVMLMTACAPLPSTETSRLRRAEVQEVASARTQIPRGALESFLDSGFAVGLPSEKIPGGVFILVQDGRVVLAKGYGVANRKTRQPVSPDSTLWRIGSISKVMTATAVVQLADRGKLRLDEDLNAYLRSVKVPKTYLRSPKGPANQGDAVNAWHLMTHTAGFDELRGRSAASREAVVPLAEFLKTRLVRVRQPGRVIAYSSFGPALEGALIEDVSNLPFETYLKNNVWSPLGMSRTNIIPADAMPTGYGVEGDSIVDAPWEWSNTAPAGMINSTAADMGRYMNMMLGHHPNGRRVLSDSARRSMLTRHITMHPQIPGVGLGFHEANVNGHVIFEHGGDIEGYSSLLVLLPEENTGFFIATHIEGTGLRYKLREQLLARFFPDRSRGNGKGAAVQRLPRVDLSEFVGEYRWNAMCRTCDGGWVPRAQQITAQGDSALTFGGQRWVPVAPLFFQTPDGRKRIGFIRDSSGAISQLATGGAFVLERMRS